MKQWKRIVCCVDAEEASIESLTEGARLARVVGGQLGAVHAARDPAVVNMDPLTASFAADGRSLELQLIPDGGHAAAAVCAWAGQEGVDVLVAAPHRGTLARLVLGSFASYIANDAPCAVLLTRPSVGATAGELPAPPGDGDEGGPLDPLVEHVEPLGADQTLREAIDRLLEEGCELPVVDDIGRLVGIIGSVEILDAMLPAYAGQIPRTGLVAHDLPGFQERAREALEWLVGDCMRAPIALRSDNSEFHAASLLMREGLRAVPVVRSWSQYTGLLRINALLRDLCQERIATPAAPRESDREATETRPFRQIACCVDDSPGSLDALAAAAHLAEMAAASLTVVHAVRSPAVGASGSAARRLLDDAVAETGARSALIYGRPWVAVGRWAADEGVDLLVAASHHGRLPRTDLGSFARHLAHRAPCSLLLTRPTATSP